MKSSVGKEGIALVLSGGAARCVAHLGFLQAMEEAGIKPAVISGVSGGAIVGAFYCNGYSPKQILGLVQKTSILKIFSPAWGTGFLKMDKAEKLFVDHLKIKNFEDLPIPLFITACDLNKSENIAFSKGDIIKPLVASCSIPPLFKAVNYAGRNLVDGGVLNNLPVEPVSVYKNILGINVNIINAASSIDSFAQYSERVADIIINNNIKESKKSCSLFLEPDELKYFRLTEIGKAGEIFAAGYDYAKKKMKAIEVMVNDE